MDAPHIIAECVRQQTEAGLVLVGSDDATLVRFEHGEPGVINLATLGPPPRRRASVACVSFRHQRWAASFLSHVVSVTPDRVQVAMPEDLMLVDYRRAERVRLPPSAIDGSLMIIGSEDMPVSVLDVSTAGVGLDVGDPSNAPDLGETVRIQLDGLVVPGVVMRTSEQIVGVAFRPDREQLVALRALIRRCTSGSGEVLARLRSA